MRIENIIDDIIQDTVDIRNRLEEQIIKQKPDLYFKLHLPQVDRLTAIRLIQLDVVEKNETRSFRAEIHAQNGYRVFIDDYRNLLKQGNDGLATSHPLQQWFILILRQTIKSKKVRPQPFQKRLD